MTASKAWEYFYKGPDLYLADKSHRAARCKACIENAVSNAVDEQKDKIRRGILNGAPQTPEMFETSCKTVNAP
jgi:hypothetical protein